MAYNDYGAFVYLNGRRRTDCEDVPVIGERDTQLEPWARIYASLARKMGQEGEVAEDATREYRWACQCHHAVLGDGRVLVGLYKTGVYASGVYVIDEGLDSSDRLARVIQGREAIIRAAGCEPVDSPRHYEDTDECRRQSQEYNRQVYGPYRYELEVAGHTIVFEAREHSDVISPACHARMTCPNGDVWDAFYDANYGAGLSDCAMGPTDADAKGTRFGSIDVEAVGRGDMRAWPVTRTLPLLVADGRIMGESDIEEHRVSARHEALAELAEALGIGGDDDEADAPEGGDDGRRADDSDGATDRILYRSLEDMSGLYEPISTIGWPDNETISTDLAIGLVRLGIRLAWLGVDQIDTDAQFVGGRRAKAASYGLDGTPFEGLSYRLMTRGMVPAIERDKRLRILQGGDGTQDKAIRDVFDAYERSCAEADGSIVIEDNEAGTELAWPIRDARGNAFTPLMVDDLGEGACTGWQVARSLDDPASPPFQVVGCGWFDEEPFVMDTDGIRYDPSRLEICDIP